MTRASSLCGQAAPVPIATALAPILGIAVKNPIRILDALVAAAIVVAGRRRSKRRLFGLQGLGPLRDAVRPPYRQDPNRGPGLPRVGLSSELRTFLLKFHRSVLCR